MAPATSTARGSRRRIQLLVLCAVAGFALLAMRATWLGAIRSSSLSKQADLQHLITVDLPAARGSILSADGQALAVDRPTMLVTADARYVTNPAQLAETITSVTRGDAMRRAKLEADLRSRKPYVILAKQVPIKEAEYLRKLDLDGVHFTRTSARRYPLDKVAGQVLGLTDVDSGKGIDGLERLENDALAGRHGTRTEIRDPRLGETVRIPSMTSPQPGKTVILTINAAIQERMEARSRRRPQPIQGEVGDGRDHGPQLGRDHRHGERAARQPERPRQPQAGDHPHPRRDRPVRAGFGVQGRDGRRRARRAAHHPEHRVQPAAEAGHRQGHSRAAHHPGGAQAHRLGDDDHHARSSSARATSAPSASRSS